MATHGGKRPNSGRKPSSATIKTREIAEKAFSDGVTPLEYMLGVMRGEIEGNLLRFEAAKAAAPYMHPRLNAIEHTGTMHMTHEQWLAELAGEDEDPDAGRTPVTH